MKSRRFRQDYDLSTNAALVRDLLNELLPFQVIYTEYPYVSLLKRYYKKYKTAKEFQDQSLLTRTKLKADFALPQLEVIVEVDGEQHFHPVQFGGISAEQAASNFEEQKYRDAVKLRIAKEMDYKLIRLPYYEEIDKEKLYDLIRG